MKIISNGIYTLLVFLLVGYCGTTEMGNSASSHSKSHSKNHNKNNSSGGIFGSISKHKLRLKSKEVSGNSQDNDSTPKGLKGPVDSKKQQSGEVTTLKSDKGGDGPMQPVQLVKGPLLWEGWVNFFIYKTANEKELLDGKVKEMYYKNLHYNEQFKKNMNLNLQEKVVGKYKYIPTPYSFYLTVFPNNINISEERIVSLIIKFIYRMLIQLFMIQSRFPESLLFLKKMDFLVD